MKSTSTYKTQVLEVNANFKMALRTTGKAIKILIASETLTPKQVTILKALQSTPKDAQSLAKVQKDYNKFDSMVRRTKANQVTPFYVLQALYKYMQ
jgi:hypothetical protein